MKIDFESFRLGYAAAKGRPDHHEETRKAFEAVVNARTPEPAADADGWFKHDGGPCPVDGDASVDILLRCGARVTAEKARAFDWAWCGTSGGADVKFWRPAR
jgi:hypothetical protein